MFKLLRKAPKQLLWAFFSIPLVFNYFIWLHGQSTSYAMSLDFERIFWILLLITSFTAYTQLDSSNYLPSFRRLGLPWQLSYFLEKLLHAICCLISMTSFLFLLTALLIRSAPLHYMEARVARLDQSRLLTYHYYWQMNIENSNLMIPSYKVDERTFKWLEDNRSERIRIRVRSNLAGASVKVIRVK